MWSMRGVARGRADFKDLQIVQRGDRKLSMNAKPLGQPLPRHLHACEPANTCRFNFTEHTVGEIAERVRRAVPELLRGCSGERHDNGEAQPE